MRSRKKRPVDPGPDIILGQTPVTSLPEEWNIPGNDDRVDIRAGIALKITNRFSVQASSFTNTSENSLENRLPSPYKTQRMTRMRMKRTDRHTGPDQLLTIDFEGQSVVIPLTNMTPEELDAMRDVLVAVLEDAYQEASSRKVLIQEVARNGNADSSLIKRLYRKLPVLHGEPGVQREYSESLRNGFKRISQVVTSGADYLGNTRGAVRNMAERGAAGFAAAHAQAADELLEKIRKARGSEGPPAGLQAPSPSPGDTAPPA